MNFYTFSAIFNAVASMMLGIIVLRKNPRSSINKIFTLFTLSVTLWSLAYAAWQASSTESGALFFARLLMVGAIFISPTYFHFILVLTHQVKQKKVIIWASYAISCIFLVLNTTNTFVTGVTPRLTFKYWPVPGPVFHLFLIYWLTLVAYTSALLFAAYKKSTQVKHLQLKYVLAGFTLGFISGSTNFLLWYNIPIPPVANMLVSLYVAGTAYAIIRYRLLDIRLVAKRSTMYVAWLISIIGIGTGVWAVLSLILNLDQLVSGITVIMITAIIANPLLEYAKIIGNKYFFSSSENYQDAIKQVSIQLVSLIDLEQIMNVITNVIIDSFKIEKHGILLFEAGNYKTKRVSGYDTKNIEELIQDEEVMNFILDEHKPIVADEIPYIMHRPENKQKANTLEHVLKLMHHQEIKILAPLIKNNQFISLIVLGEKVSKEAYSKEDIELLEIVSNQAAIALENAQLYEHMEEKVAAQTKEIKQLYKVREEFLSIASHQLKTPNFAASGLLSMVVNGYVNADEKDKFIRQAYESTEKMGRVIQEILTFSEIESGKFKLVTREIDLVELLKRTMNHFEMKAKAKGLSMNLQYDEHKKYNAVIDEKIHEVFANLIDNALDYTQTGGLTINLSQEDSCVTISFKDTGIGIPLGQQQELFQKFKRADNARLMKASGSGIGLYVVKRLLDEMHCQIKVSSEGEGKGTEFKVYIPTEK